MDWSDLRYLLALKRAGNIAAAARELKVDHSTVSRRIAALEESAGTQLVRRTPDGLVLTDAGCAVAKTAESIEAQVQSLKTSLTEDAAAEGTVKLTFPDGFMPYIVSAVSRLRDLHPAVNVELVAGARPLDLARGEADVGLRPVRPTQPGLVGKKIGVIGWSLYVSDAYVKRRGMPQLGALAGHDVVAYGEQLKVIPGQVWLDEHARDAKAVLRCNDTRSVVLAVREGLGFAALPCFLAAGDPELRRMTPNTIATPDTFAVFAADLQRVARVRVVVDMLCDMFKREEALFTGRA